MRDRRNNFRINLFRGKEDAIVSHVGATDTEVNGRE